MLEFLLVSCGHTYFWISYGFWYRFMVSYPIKIHRISIKTVSLVLGKKQKREKLALRLWSLATSVICLLDLILSILLGIDYQNCFNDASRVVFAELASEQVCANIILPVLIIAAKGFTLWIVNVIFAFILFRISTQLPDKQQDSAS